MNAGPGPDLVELAGNVWQRGDRWIGRGRDLERVIRARTLDVATGRGCRVRRLPAVGGNGHDVCRTACNGGSPLLSRWVARWIMMPRFDNRRNTPSKLGG